MLSGGFHKKEVGGSGSEKWPWKQTSEGHARMLLVMTVGAPSLPGAVRESGGGRRGPQHAGYHAVAAPAGPASGPPCCCAPGAVLAEHRGPAGRDPASLTTGRRGPRAGRSSCPPAFPAGDGPALGFAAPLGGGRAADGAFPSPSVLIIKSTRG